ncbi:MAG: hypothetical protein ACFFDK_05160 [Promethearchaeota archaeon]
MITWILGSILIVWCLYKRFGKDGYVEGYPLGMPRGSVRALIAILVVAFPFSYLIVGQEIPSAITSAIFILVAFYFQTRKARKDLVLELIDDARYPEKPKEKMIYPLYLPKYSVRITLVAMLVLILIINAYGPMVPFETTNTLVDILLIITFFILGSIFKRIGNIREEKKNKRLITMKLAEDPSISNEGIIEYLSSQDKSWLKKKGKNCLSVITLIAIIFALFLYTIEIDYELLTFLFYAFTLRTVLFLFINIYYGFRD